MRRPVVAVLSMGGTISCAPADTGGLVPARASADGLALCDVEVRSISWSLTDSTEITLDEMVRLAAEIRRLATTGVDGVVVTQGTDTLEESVYAMSLLRPLERPVVFTAAMRAPDRPGSDALANLLDAIRASVDPDLARSREGAVVVMDERIHGARWVHKGHTQHLDAFDSGETGPLGVLAEGTPILLGDPPVSTVPSLLEEDTGGGAPVAMLTAVLDDSTALIEALLPLGYRGLVIEGAGGGHVSAAAAEALGEVAREIPVVLAARPRSGAVLTRTYGSPGAEIDLLARGCVPAGRLSALKARMLLALLLRTGMPRTPLEELIRAESGVPSPSLG
jgi:L-asparaginase